MKKIRLRMLNYYFSKPDKNYNVRTIGVPGGTSRAVYFPIVLTRIGRVRLHVLAQAGQAADAVEEQLRVEPEGYRIERNVPMVVELNDAAAASKSEATNAPAADGASSPSPSISAASNAFNRTVELQIPSDAIEGSVRARVDVIADIMGPVLANIANLVSMPYGCGEQNMLNFVPNIVVLRYLRATQKRSPALEATIINYMEAGYQRQLTYK